jgi:hypothetical protein
MRQQCEPGLADRLQETLRERAAERRRLRGAAAGDLFDSGTSVAVASQNGTAAVRRRPHRIVGAPSSPVRSIRPAARPRARAARRRVSGSRAGPSDDGREPELALRHVAEILDLFERRADERRQAEDARLVQLLRETDPTIIGNGARA